MISLEKSFYFFADDSKCFKPTYDSQDYLQLQKDLNSLYSWIIRSNLLFSLTKILFIWEQPPSDNVDVTEDSSHFEAEEDIDRRMEQMADVCYNCVRFLH